MEAKLEVTDVNGNIVSIEGSIPLLLTKKEKNWVAYSPHFRTLGYSKLTKEEAVAEFSRALEIFFKVHIKRGTLEKALIEFGWKKISNVFTKSKYFNTPETIDGGELIEFPLPNTIKMAA